MRSRTSLALVTALLALSWMVAMGEAVVGPSGVEAGGDLLPQTAPSPAHARLPELAGQLGGAIGALAVQNNVAYVGVGPRLVVVDASDPAAPSRLGETGPLSDRFDRIAVRGRYVFLTAGDSGLRIFDVADAAHPIEVGGFPVPGADHGLAVVDRYAYVTVADGTIRVIDITEPSQPAEVGRVPIAAAALAVDGNRAYAVGSAFSVLDLSDPAAPVPIGVLAVPETEGLSRAVAAAGPYAYIATSSAVSLRFSAVSVLDVSDPFHPRPLGSVMTNVVSSLVVHAGALYATTWTPLGFARSLVVIDVSQPARPVRTATAPLAGAADVAVEPASGRVQVYATDGRALRIFDASDAGHPALLGRYTPPVTGGATGIAVAGTHALLTLTGPGCDDAPPHAACHGLALVDVGDPAAPSLSGVYDPPASAGAAAPPSGIGWATLRATAVGGNAFLFDGAVLRVLDVADPAHPRVVGTRELPAVRREAGGAGKAALAVSGTRAYLATADGLYVLDVEHPASPALVGFAAAVAPHTGWPRAIAVDRVVAGDGAGRELVYVAMGVALAPPGNERANGGVRVLDVSDPAAPRELAFYEIPGAPPAPGASDYVQPGSGSGVAASGGHVFLVGGSTSEHLGLFVLDVSDPDRPREMATLRIGAAKSPPDGGLAVAFDGTTVYVAAADGVHVVEIADPALPAEVGLLPTPWPATDVTVDGGTVYAAAGPAGMWAWREPVAL